MGRLFGWFASFVGSCEWLVLRIALDFGFVKITADKAPGVENGILRVGMERVLCAITDIDIDGTTRVVSKKKKRTCQWDTLASICWGWEWSHHHRSKLGLGGRMGKARWRRHWTRLGVGETAVRHPGRDQARGLSPPSKNAGAREGHCRRRRHRHWVKLGEKRIKDKKIER